jgi:hypothetical protein
MKMIFVCLKRDDVFIGVKRLKKINVNIANGYIGWEVVPIGGFHHNVIEPILAHSLPGPVFRGLWGAMETSKRPIRVV